MTTRRERTEFRAPWQTASKRNRTVSAKVLQPPTLIGTSAAVGHESQGIQRGHQHRRIESRGILFGHDTPTAPTCRRFLDSGTVPVDVSLYSL